METNGKSRFSRPRKSFLIARGASRARSGVLGMRFSMPLKNSTVYIFFKVFYFFGVDLEKFAKSKKSPNPYFTSQMTAIRGKHMEILENRDFRGFPKGSTLMKIFKILDFSIFWFISSILRCQKKNLCATFLRHQMLQAPENLTAASSSHFWGEKIK